MSLVELANDKNNEEEEELIKEIAETEQSWTPVVTLLHLCHFATTMKLSLLCFVVSFSVYDKGECTCFFKNQDFVVDTMFKDPDNPCLTYVCTKEGFTTKVEECPEQAWCRKELRTYDDNGCCYSCKNDCRLVPVQISLSRNGCKGTIRMQMCKGHCKQIVSYSDDDRRIKKHCSCCKETTYIDKKAQLFCSGGELKPYMYKETVSCSCTPCKDA